MMKVGIKLYTFVLKFHDYGKNYTNNDKLNEYDNSFFQQTLHFLKVYQ